MFIIAMAALSAQNAPPQKISYQAVVRNSVNQLLPNAPIGVRVSILQSMEEGNPDGTLVYQEVHQTTTNVNGLMTLVIGEGSVLSGTFATIDWGTGLSIS